MTYTMPCASCFLLLTGVVEVVIFESLSVGFRSEQARVWPLSRQSKAQMQVLLMLCMWWQKRAGKAAHVRRMRQCISPLLSQSPTYRDSGCWWMVREITQSP